MDPLTDFDRDLREALQVEPSGGFTARIRTGVARSPRPVLIPKVALATLACAWLAAITSGFWREGGNAAAEAALPYRELIVLSQPSSVMASPPRLTAPTAAITRHGSEVLVSRSEMLALQRLFSGVIVAPAALPATPAELSIPKLEIEPISPVVAGSEGERR